MKRVGINVAAAIIPHSPKRDLLQKARYLNTDITREPPYISLEIGLGRHVKN